METHSSILAWRIPGRRSLLGCRLWGCTESSTTEATWQKQQQQQAVVNRKSGWIQERTGYKGLYLIRNIYELEIQICKFLPYTPLLILWKQIRWYKAYTEKKKKGDLGQKLKEHCHIRVDRREATREVEGKPGSCVMQGQEHFKKEALVNSLREWTKVRPSSDEWCTLSSLRIYRQWGSRPPLSSEG